MNLKLAIGAPSLTGKGVHDETVATAAGMEFPCRLFVVNHMPRAAVFPESGIELASTLADSGSVAEATFASAAVLQRLIRTASEVAELNGYALALTISDAPPEPAVVDDAAATDAQTPAVDTNTTSDGEGAGGEGSDAGDPPATDAAPATAPNAGGTPKKKK